MSFVSVYVDPKRAVVACDDRTTLVDADGNYRPAEGRHAKFTLLNDRFILCATGRSDLTARLFEGTERLAADYSETSFAELTSFLSWLVPKLFASRPSLTGPAASFDHFAAALVGFDPDKAAMRCVWWRSEQSFAPVDLDVSHQRLSCDGFHDEGDAEFLQVFARSLSRAERFGPAWIGCQLRRLVEVLHERHPNTIGPAAFFAAIDRSGRIELPAEFPLPEVEEVTP